MEIGGPQVSGSRTTDQIELTIAAYGRSPRGGGSTLLLWSSSRVILSTYPLNLFNPSLGGACTRRVDIG